MAILAFEVVDALVEEGVVTLLATIILELNSLAHSSLVLGLSVKFATSMDILHWNAIITLILLFRLQHQLTRHSILPLRLIWLNRPLLHLPLSRVTLRLWLPRLLLSMTPSSIQIQAPLII